MLDHIRVDNWLLLPQRIALHEPTGTAIVADVHLGYSERRRRLGDAVPIPRVATLLAPLRRVAATWDVKGLVVAGDLFERGFDAALFAQFRDELEKLRLPFLGLVPGNHDRLAAGEIAGLPLWRDGYLCGSWRIRHGDEAHDGPVVMGHWHPAVRVGGRKQPCFLVGAEKIVLPAYTADAAGVELRRQPNWCGARAIAIMGAQLLEIRAGSAQARRSF